MMELLVIAFQLYFNYVAVKRLREGDRGVMKDFLYKEEL
jgi:hypothetical protein